MLQTLLVVLQAMVLLWRVQVPQTAIMLPMQVGRGTEEHRR